MRFSPRFYGLLGLVLLGFLALVLRLFYLGVLDRGFLVKQSDSRALRVINTAAYRGMITDRYGEPLAMSTLVSSVCGDPQLLKLNDKQYTALAKLLHVSKKSLKQSIASQATKQFIYLKRHLPLSIDSQLKALHLPGVFVQHEFKRYYPQGSVAAQVVGFTNIDDKGQEGLELAYNNWLTGVPGRRLVMKDRLGNVIDNVNQLKQSKQGRNLVLSLDHRIQYQAYQALQQAVSNYHADSGSVVVLDVQTGEILAMVNMPTYNPNHRVNVIKGAYRNRAVTDLFEPGSTMKAFSVASALATGEYTPESVVDTNPGWMMLNGYTIKDDGLNNGKITVTQVLQKSSNVGIAKITLAAKDDHLWQMLNSVGFGMRTLSGFPGEVSGHLPDYDRLRSIDRATLSFGYGVSITALQLAHAYATIADHGAKVPVTFLKSDEKPHQVQVLTPAVADEMVKMLQSVLKPEGTGRLAKVLGYQVAGKTGTAYIATKGGYDRKHYVASFVGIAPASRPRLVVAVIIRNPHGNKHFGGQVAAPAFAQVMGGALRLMNIPPDGLTEKDGLS